MSKPRTIADFPNKADDYDEAVSKSHVQNTDTALDQGGDNEITAEDIRDHVDSTENPHQVTAEQVGAYTKGETDDMLDDKADQSDLNATNQAVSALDGRVDTAEDDIQGLESSKVDQSALEDLFTTDIEMALATQGGLVGLENNRPQIVSRAGNIYTIDFQINVTSNTGANQNFVILSGITGLENTQTLGHFFSNTNPVHTGIFYIGNQNSFGTGAILVRLE